MQLTERRRGLPKPMNGYPCWIFVEERRTSRVRGRAKRKSDDRRAEPNDPSHQ